MSIANKIFTNTLWQVIIRGVNILIAVFNLALITRILGQTGFGFFTTIFAFVQMIMVFADLGLYLVLLREISSVKKSEDESRVINNIFTIRLLSSLLILVLAPLLVNIFPYDQAVKTGVILFSFSFFFQSLISTLTAIFAKKLEMPKVAIVDFCIKGVFLLSLIYLFKFHGNLNTVLIVHLGSYVIGFMLFYQFLKKYVLLRLAWDFNYWKKIFHYAWPLAITVVLNLMYFKADTLILALFKGPNDVALYGAPYRVLEVLVTFPHMFMSLILPLFTAAWVSKNLDNLKNIFQNTFDFFVILIIPMVLGTWLISKQLMVLLAGDEFVVSGAILNILILATAVIFFGVLLTYLVVALQAQKQMIKYFLMTTIIGAIGYFIFIPRFSYWGAAYMTLFVEFLIVVFSYLVVRKHLKLSVSCTVLGKSLLAGLVMFLIGWLIKEINIVLTIIVAGLVYISVLYLTKAVDKQLIKEMFNKV